MKPWKHRWLWGVELLDRTRLHKSELVGLLVDEESRRAHGKQLSLSRHPLIVAAWKLKECCGKIVYQSLDNGFWYSQDMAMHLQDLGRTSL